MATAAELILKIDADVKGAQAAIDNMRKQLRSAQKDATIVPTISLASVKAEFGRGLIDIKQKFAEGFSNVGSGVLGEIAKNLGTLVNPAGAAVAGIAALGSALVDGTKRALEFEAGLTNLSVITGIGGRELESLGDKAREIALRFGGEATSQLNLMSIALSKLGPDLARSQEQFGQFIDNVNVFAKATGQDAAVAGQQLMDVMLQVGVNVSDANEVVRASSELMDVLAKAAQEGAAETSQLAESYLQVGSTAKQLNLSSTQVAAALEGLAFAGKTGAEAGVGLRNVLTSLVKTSSAAEKALNTIGLSSQELGRSLSERGIADTLQLLQDGLSKLGSDAERSALLVRVFGKENLAAAGGLLNNLDKIRDLQKRIDEGAKGAALQQAQTRMATMGEMLERLKTASGLVLEVLGQQVLRVANLIGSMFNDASVSATNVVKSVGAVISSFVDTIQPAIVTIGGALRIIINTLSSIGQGLGDALDGVGEGVNLFELLSNVIRQVLTVVGDAIAVVGRFVGLIAGAAIRGAVGIYSAIVNTFRSLVNAIVEAYRNSTLLQSIFFALKSIVDNVVNSIASLYNWLKRLLGGQEEVATKSNAVVESQKEVQEVTQRTVEAIKQANVDYTALASSLELVAQRAKQYVDAVRQYVDLAAKQSALDRGIVSPDTATQLDAARIQLGLLQNKLIALARSAGVEASIRKLLTEPLELSAEAAQRWADAIARANPIVVKAEQEMQSIAAAEDDAATKAEAMTKAKEKYQQALSKAKGEALQLVNEVIKLRQQSQELELKIAVDRAKQELDTVTTELSKLSDVSVAIALDAASVAALRGRYEETISVLRERLKTLGVGSDEAKVVNDALGKVIAAYEKFEQQLAQKTQEGIKLREEVRISAINDEREREREERLLRLNEEEAEWIRKAEIVQAGEETIRAIRERYATLRQQLLDVEAQRWNQVHETMLRSSDTFLNSLTSAFGSAFIEIANNAQEGMRNFNRTVASAIIDLLEALLPAWIAGATGAEVGSKGIIGLGTAGILVAALKVLFAAARAALQRGFAEGGFTGYGKTTDVAGVVHRREYVVRAPYAERYMQILELMNKGVYRPQMLVLPTLQQVRVELGGTLQVRAKGEWLDAQRNVALRVRMAS